MYNEEEEVKDRDYEIGGVTCARASIEWVLGWTLDRGMSLSWTGRVSLGHRVSLRTLLERQGVTASCRDRRATAH